MAAFWTWLWGPVGLVLATPLTVCVVVFSKYVPEMNFVTVLLSDAPALEPHVNYYQRMLALDQDESEKVVEEYLKSHSPVELYDRVLLPALSRAKNDRRRAQLTEKEEQAVYEGTRAILEDFADEREAAPADNEASDARAFASGQVSHALGFPADGKADEVSLLALAKLLDGQRYKIDVISPDMLASEMVTLLGQKQPGLVCIGALAPGGLAHARYLCKRIRARFPEIKILVGRWCASENIEAARATLTSAGADRVAATLHEAHEQLVRLAQLTPAAATPARLAAS
jgi:hypothetical protein